MADIAFYHLTHSGAEVALPALLEKVLSTGKKALVCAKPEHFGDLSSALWGYRKDSWLPHGMMGDDDAPNDTNDIDICPILFAPNASGHANENDRPFVFYLDGIDPPVDSQENAERIFILFDGKDEAAVAAARRQWLMLKDPKTHILTYWQQGDDGRWSKSA